MTDELTSLAAQLDAVVRSVPSVAALYAAEPSLLRSVRELTTGPDTPIALVSVRRVDEGLAIVASVAASGRQQAPVTALAVSTAIRSVLAPGVEAEILVRVSRIEG
ncbi:hypothetical protein F1C58_10620 [Glaciihabitans sp. INWT7]|uniref:hypothetical protein n=1 Tax=Glaciihabitans sp. INWT7 TaxID=2596912 RepID=UPI00162454FE|nr:hypothetical protein [Glaciihabitans sp. INWT7]QNE47303.1 hypothetical protein F1C58_10620 [Glaciihabitans sp. INWT7]